MVSGALAATVLAVASLAGDSESEGWPRFRGPDGAGLSAARTVPTSFDEDDYNWRVELPGPGSSSPVIRDGKVFVTCETGTGELTLVCLAAADGAERWRKSFAFEPYGQHELNSFAAATPALDAERVYVTWRSGEARIVEALTLEGESVWRRELAPYRGQHGAGASPVVVEGVVILTHDNGGRETESFLIGLDASTGETAWKRARKTSYGAYSTPTVLRTGASSPQVLFTSTSHGVTSLDPRTGELRWEVDGVFARRCTGSPVVAGDLVFATAGNGGSGKESVAVEFPGTADGDDPAPAVRYRLGSSLPYVPTPIAVGELLFLWSDGGIVSCLRAADGERLWRERLSGEFFGSPICVADRLYAISKDGVLFVLAAAKTFDLLGQVDLDEPSNATPAVAGGVLYLRTERHLISVGGASD